MITQHGETNINIDFCNHGDHHYSLGTTFADKIYTRVKNGHALTPYLKNNTKVWPFVSAADSATSWYLASATGDDGLNTEMQKYFADAINQIGQSDNTELLTNLKNGIIQLQTKYGLKR